MDKDVVLACISCVFLIFSIGCLVYDLKVVTADGDDEGTTPVQEYTSFEGLSFDKKIEYINKGMMHWPNAYCVVDGVEYKLYRWALYDGTENSMIEAVSSDWSFEMISVDSIDGLIFKT